MAGSVTPDLPYFVPGLPFKSLGHSAPGLLLFCLPAGLLAYGAFHLLLAPLSYELAPGSLRSRVPRDQCRGALPAHTALAVVASVLIGAATHLAWDSFTHAKGAVVLHLPALSSEIVSWQGYTVYVYKVLQHGSTFAGLALLAYWCVRWYQRALVSPLAMPPSPIRRLIFASAILIPSTAAAAIGAALSLQPGTLALRQLQLATAGAIHTGVAALLVCSLAVAGIRRLAMPRAG